MHSTFLNSVCLIEFLLCSSIVYSFSFEVTLYFVTESRLHSSMCSCCLLAMLLPSLVVPCWYPSNLNHLGEYKLIQFVYLHQHFLILFLHQDRDIYGASYLLASWFGPTFWSVSNLSCSERNQPCQILNPGLQPLFHRFRFDVWIFLLDNNNSKKNSNKVSLFGNMKYLCFIHYFHPVFQIFLLSSLPCIKNLNSLYRHRNLSKLHKWAEK